MSARFQIKYILRRHFSDVHIYARWRKEPMEKEGIRRKEERERERRENCIWLPPLNHLVVVVGTLTENGAKYLAKYLHDKYVCPVTEILLSELMEAVAKRSVHSPFLLNHHHPSRSRHREYRGESFRCK